jgi:hypothetical protein
MSQQEPSTQSMGFMFASPVHFEIHVDSTATHGHENTSLEESQSSATQPRPPMQQSADSGGISNMTVDGYPPEDMLLKYIFTSFANVLGYVPVLELPSHVHAIRVAFDYYPERESVVYAMAVKAQEAIKNVIEIVHEMKWSEVEICIEVTTKPDPLTTVFMYALRVAERTPLQMITNPDDQHIQLAKMGTDIERFLRKGLQYLGMKCTSHGGSEEEEEEITTSHHSLISTNIVYQCAATGQHDPLAYFATYCVDTINWIVGQANDRNWAFHNIKFCTHSTVVDEETVSVDLDVFLVEEIGSRSHTA